MSVSFYDKALLDKIKYWTSKTDLHVYGPSESTRLFETMGDISNDSPVKLPLVVLSHRGGYTIDNPNKKPLTFDAVKVEHDESTGAFKQLNGVPITIPYQIDVYTKYFEDTDMYIRNFVFNIINYPSFQVVIPFSKVDYVHNAKMRLASNVMDNSDIPELLIKGEFFRMSLEIDVDDAYLWDVKSRSPVFLSLDAIDIQKYPNGNEVDFIEESI